ncbi:MAG: sigma-54-dependent Fis family transcriptional regulator, partial [Deltaproteobacteria bacterium]|nr:sigma-54-dependent Fis family transcriptional regulator [Deltaproteobacteria bacterium]
MRRVLVVDDEENIRVVLRTLLKKQNYQVETAESAEIALEQLERFDPDFVLADVRMSGMTGLELCAELKARSSLATVILMSAYGSVDLAIEAMKVGAYDYISKPFKQDEVLIALTKAEERESLRRENRALKEAIRKEQTVHGILGKSDAISKVFSTISKVADYKTTVLIQGESGTGKELVARALHSGSSRKNKPFIPLNCGAIPETLLESELFGHKKGAFTDAHADKKGLFAEAHQGTLFLDEIGELPLTLQVK